jgi:hypothetical protein
MCEGMPVVRTNPDGRPADKTNMRKTLWFALMTALFAIAWLVNPG